MDIIIKLFSRLQFIDMFIELILIYYEDEFKYKLIRIPYYSKKANIRYFFSA